MVRKNYKMVRFGGLLVGFLLSSCAQIGTITGGEKDMVPPRIEKSIPADGSVNVNTSQIQIEFDEFVVLQKPKENLVLLPSNVSYETKLINKTLILDLQDELAANTTYSLYLNGAIKDLTEGNDTLIQLVFSTGPFLDSNIVDFQVKDAYTNEIQSGITVGLFDSLEQLQPIYFSKTDDEGRARIRAIADGEYFYAAFSDENQNRARDVDEFQFADKYSIQVDSSFKDTLKLVTSKPLVPKSSLSASFISPYILAIRIPAESSFEGLEIKGLNIAQTPIKEFNWDSIHFYLPTYHEFLQVSFDTLSKKVRNKKDLTTLSLFKDVKKFTLLPDDCCLKMSFDMPLESIDLTKGSFRLFSPQDSSYQEIQTGITILNNTLSFDTKGYACNNVRFEIDSGSIVGANGSVNSGIQTVIQRKEPEDLGILNVDIGTFIEHWFIVLEKDGKEIARRNALSASQSVKFQNLIPGNYTVHVVEDVNENEIWDPFEPKSFSPPERRFSFARKTSVKANFEHEIDFVIPE
tara:strand:+ start:4067 stop:5626 length:1560 start_codon:yes stop_codon:yes gene_type:complete